MTGQEEIDPQDERFRMKKSEVSRLRLVLFCALLVGSGGCTAHVGPSIGYTFGRGISYGADMGLGIGGIGGGVALSGVVQTRPSPTGPFQGGDLVLAGGIGLMAGSDFSRSISDYKSMTDEKLARGFGSWGGLGLGYSYASQPYEIVDGRYHKGSLMVYSHRMMRNADLMGPYILPTIGIRYIAGLWEAFLSLQVGAVTYGDALSF